MIERKHSQLSRIFAYVYIVSGSLLFMTCKYNPRDLALIFFQSTLGKVVEIKISSRAFNELYHLLFFMTLVKILQVCLLLQL